MSLGKLFLLRHGETLWSKSGQHTGRTDIPLTEAGRKRAREVAPLLKEVHFELVLCSPLSRAKETADLAGLKPDEYSDDLLEWNYGIYEGITTKQIREDKKDPHWLIWDNPIPEGESPEEVAVRARHVLERVTPVTDAGKSVMLVAHGHYLRILTAIYLGLDPRAGRLFALDAGGVAVLGHERTQPVIAGWNINPDGLSD